MARLVNSVKVIRTESGGIRTEAKAGGGGDPDDYASRVAKYIPGEVVAGYITIVGILKTALVGAAAGATTTPPAGNLPSAGLIQTVGWVAFGACLVFTPLYFRAQRQPGQPWHVHAAVSTVAFVVWAYALGGVFDMARVYYEFIGSIVLILFTLLAGLIPNK